jgi:hypothetical protein
VYQGNARVLNLSNIGKCTIGTFKKYLASINWHQARNDFYKSTFSRTIFANDSMYLTLLQFEIDVVQNLCFAVPLG